MATGWLFVNLFIDYIIADDEKFLRISNIWLMAMYQFFDASAITNQAYD